MKRIVWIVVLVVIVGAGIFRVATRERKAPARSIQDIQAEQGIPVDVATVKRGAVRVVREVVGEVAGAQQSTLRSPGAQKIARVAVREGERVGRGQTLLEFDITVAPDRMARLSQVKETYENARRQVDRLTPLFAEGAVSESDLDAAKMQLAIAAADLRNARLEVELVSPINGFVTLVTVRAGDAVDDAAVLVQVAVLDSLRVDANVSATAAAELAPGDAVFVGFQTGSPEAPRAADGRIKRVSLGADPDTRLFRVEATIRDGQRRLAPGQVVTLGVVVDEAADAILMPAEAIESETALVKGSRVPVFVIRDGVAHRVEVELGRIGNHAVEVASGLAAGDQVVVFGANRLTDGARAQLHKVDGVRVSSAAEGEEAGGR